MSAEKKVTLTSIEDAWNLAKKNGYEGTLEEFDVMCRNAAEQMTSQKMDLDSMDAVAGGSVSEVLGDIGDWCGEHKEMLIGIASGVATLAASYGIYRYVNKNNKSNIPDDRLSVYSIESSASSAFSLYD